MNGKGAFRGEKAGGGAFLKGEMRGGRGFQDRKADGGTSAFRAVK